LTHFYNQWWLGVMPASVRWTPFPLFSPLLTLYPYRTPLGVSLASLFSHIDPFVDRVISLEDKADFLLDQREHQQAQANRNWVPSSFLHQVESQKEDLAFEDLPTKMLVQARLPPLPVSRLRDPFSKFYPRLEPFQVDPFVDSAYVLDELTIAQVLQQEEDLRNFEHAQAENLIDEQEQLDFMAMMQADPEL
jgi:hypothetical protein